MAAGRYGKTALTRASRYCPPDEWGAGCLDGWVWFQVRLDGGLDGAPLSDEILVSVLATNVCARRGRIGAAQALCGEQVTVTEEAHESRASVVVVLPTPPNIKDDIRLARCTTHNHPHTSAMSSRGNQKAKRATVASAYRLATATSEGRCHRPHPEIAARAAELACQESVAPPLLHASPQGFGWS